MKTDKAVRNSRRLRGFFKDGARMIRNNPVFRGEDERGRRPPPGRPTIPDRKCRELGGRFRRPLPAKSRISFDFFAYYSSGDEPNQIINVPSDWATGASSMVINAGCVRNEGIELSARFQLVKTKNWRWNIDANWAKNWNELVELPPGRQCLAAQCEQYHRQQSLHLRLSGRRVGGVSTDTGSKAAQRCFFYYDADGHKIDCSGQHIVDASTGNPILDATNPQGPGQYLPPSGRPA